MPGADISPWELLPFTLQLFKGKGQNILHVSFSLLLLFILMLFQNFPSILLAELLCFVCVAPSWQAVNLRCRTEEERRLQTLCNRRDNNLVCKNFLPNFTFFKQIFCQRPENINVKWRSRQSVQEIALSRLSHTSVLPSSSFCRPVAETH